MATTHYTNLASHRPSCADSDGFVRYNESQVDSGVRLAGRDSEVRDELEGRGYSEGTVWVAMMRRRHER